jgi:hypothetical protein
MVETGSPETEPGLQACIFFILYMIIEKVIYSCPEN